MEKEGCRMELKIMKVNPKDVNPFESGIYYISEIVDSGIFFDNIKKYKIPQLDVVRYKDKLYSLQPSSILSAYQTLFDESLVTRVFEVETEEEIEKVFMISNFPYFEVDFLNIFDSIKRIDESDIPFKNEYILRMKKIDSLSFFGSRENNVDLF
jgi:hypothetical protein